MRNHKTTRLMNSIGNGLTAIGNEIYNDSLRTRITEIDTRMEELKKQKKELKVEMAKLKEEKKKLESQLM